MTKQYVKLKNFSASDGIVQCRSCYENKENKRKGQTHKTIKQKSEYDIIFLICKYLVLFSFRNGAFTPFLIC